MIQRLLKDSFIYGLSGIISSFISIFLIPLYTKVFTPADYGIISILTTTAVLLNIFIVFGLDNSVAVWYWDKTSNEERKKTFNSWIWFLGVCGIIAMAIMFLLSDTLSNIFFSSDQYAILFKLLGFTFLFSGFQKVVNIWCRMQRQPWRALSFSLVILLCTVIFNILFILVLKIGLIGVFYSQLIAGFAGFIYMLFLYKSLIDINSFSYAYLKKMLKFSLPLVPAAIMYWLMNIASVYFIKLFVTDNTEIGLYQIGANVANILSLSTWAFFQAWTPFALSVSKEKSPQLIYSKVFYYYCILGFFLSFNLLFFAKDILYFFTSEAYINAWFVLGLLAFNVIILGIPNILSIANSLTKNNASYALSMLVGSIVTVLLFLLLIPKYGKEGAAIAMILGNLSRCIYLIFKVQKLYYIPYKFLQIFIIVLALGLIYFLGLYITDNLISKILFVMVIFTLLSIWMIKTNKSLMMYKQIIFKRRL